MTLETSTNLLLLLIAIAVLLGIRLLFFSRRPTKTDTRYTDFWGRRKRRIRYSDTGKVVHQSFGVNWRGQSEKKTYVEKRCFRCGAKVTAVKNGVYRCKCGNRFK